MTTIRIGNDINVRWSVFSRNGAPYVLDGSNVNLWLVSGPFKKRIVEYSTIENLVSFSIDAKDIFRLGIYKMVLSLTDTASETEDSAFDFTEAFQIVSKTYSDSTDAVLDGDVVVTPSSIIDNIVVYNLTNAPDGEDLTSVDNVLKLRNRGASETMMGYVILRGGKTFAEQVTEENTIYEIRYNFDLDGESFTVPSNSALKFNGGVLSNGTLVGQNTSIVSEGGKCLDTDMVLSGTFASPLRLSLFGISGDNPDNATIWKALTFRNAGENSLELDSDVIFTEGDIQMPQRVQLNGGNHTIRFRNISSVSHGLIILGFRGKIYDLSICAPQGYDGSILVANTNVADVQNFSLNNITIDGGYLSDQNYQCVGIDIYTDNSSVVSGHMTGWFVNNVDIWWVKIGIRINGVNYNKENANDFCWMNSMFFDNIYITGSGQGIDIGFTDNGITNTAKAVGYFYFNHIEYQPKTFGDAQCMFIQHGNFTGASYRTFISNSINWDCPLLGRVVSGQIYATNITNVGEYDDNTPGTDAYGDYDTIYRMVRLYSGGRFFLDYALSSELNLISPDYTKTSGTQRYRIKSIGTSLDIRRQNNGMTHYIKRADESAFSIDNYRARNNFGFLKSDDSTPTQYYQWLSRVPGQSGYRIMDFVRQNPILETPGDLIWADSYSNKEVYGLKVSPSIVAGSSVEFKAVLKFMNSEGELVNYSTYLLSAICPIDLPRSFSKAWSQKFDVYNVHYAIESNELVLYFTAKALESVSGINYIWFEAAYTKGVAAEKVTTTDDGFIYVNRSKTDFLQSATVTLLGTIVPANTTANRPAYAGLPVGFMYFDTTLGKPIFVSSNSGGTITWVDASGTTV